jgi:uncharacterized phage-associated protein
MNHNPDSPDAVDAVRCQAATARTPYSLPVPVTAHAIAAELHARRPGLGKLALHKLLYYCQGHHLATFNQPLFDEPISAWDHGPVVGEVWYAQDRGTKPPASPELGEAQLNTIGYVLSRYGGLSGQDLMHLTHSEDPWRLADANRKPGTSNRIEQSWIREYFLANRDNQGLDKSQVDALLSDAESRRDLPGRPDDPAKIAERIRKLRESITQ